MIQMKTLVRRDEACEIPLDADGNPGYVIIGFRLDRRSLLEQLSVDRIVQRQDGSPLTGEDLDYIITLLGEHSIYRKETSIRLSSGGVITRYRCTDNCIGRFPYHLYRLAGDDHTYFTLREALLAAGYPYPETEERKG